MRSEAEATLIPGLAAALNPLWFQRYRLRLTPTRPLVLTLFGRGSTLRGGFALAFRRLVCHDLSLVCRQCPLFATCPYPEVFEPCPPRRSDRLSTFQDLPRPFVIDPPRDPRTTFEPGQALEFGLTVVGQPTRHLPLFVGAVQSLADSGLGRGRASFTVEEVVALGPSGERVSVYRQGAVALAGAPTVRARDLVRPGDELRSDLTLRFVTATDLRDGGQPVVRAAFGPLIRRLRDRVSALAAFFGDGPLQMDFKAVGTQADSVRVAEDRTRHVDVLRRSGRTGQRHDVGGVVGEARFEGDAIGRLTALVRVGEALHVGKHAAFGNGWIEVIA
jgi:hypothetical protein